MTKIYEARFVPDAAIRLDGAPDESAWQRADVLTDFVFPWEDDAPPVTEFRALCDGKVLYFAFRVEDDDLVVAEDFRDKEDVTREDRVELFLSPDDRLGRYFCLEIDPLGRVLDYRAEYHRRFDFSWSFPGLKVAAARTDAGYTVEGRIPLRSLESLGLGPASRRPIRCGIYRAEFRHSDGPHRLERWISWVDPETSEPDFHIPATFGHLRIRTA